MNDVTLQIGQGGLQRVLPGKDYVSGMVFYQTSAAGTRYKFLSLADAVAQGYDTLFTDETPATGEIQITTAGTNGDTINISIQEYTALVNLGTYTKVSGDSTDTLVATAIAAVINAGTGVHGYSATSSTDTVTITARKGMGIYLNSGSPIVQTLSAGATIATSITQFSGGVASYNAIVNYHVGEFFRMQPNGILYLSVNDPGTGDFSEITSLSDFAGGDIRQFGVYTQTTFASTQITKIQLIINALTLIHVPNVSVILCADIHATADVSTLTTRSGDLSPGVSVVIAQDGAAAGWILWKTTGKSIGILGATLGMIALAGVEEDISDVGKFNFSNGIELDTIDFANGQDYFSVSTATLNQLDSYRYIFLRKFSGFAGSYTNDSHTCSLLSSDFAYIENNRTIAKAMRLLYLAYLPLLAGDITLKSDGTLTNQSASAYRVVGEQQLGNMQNNGELSAYSVSVNANQNVLSTGKLIIGVSIIPIGISRNIVINIGYTTTL